MATINPYLNFQGNTEEAFNFYKSVFGGEFAMVMRFSDTEHGANVPDEDKDKIMHIALPIWGNMLMGTDCLTSMGQKLNFGDNFSISVSPDSMAETEAIFKGLSEGANVIVPLKKEFWGDYFGLLFDKFGIQWMVNYREVQQ
nr:VOC family protein [uncultured Mucilaginibacter sp.]